MKGISKKQKFWAVLGAGLLVAAASGSALAMHATLEGDTRSVEVHRSEVQPEKKSTTHTSPLPTPTVEPTGEPTPESRHEVEFTGPVEVIASDMWVVGGRTVAVTAATEIKPGLDIGALAKVHAVVQADGTLLAREIEPVHGDDNGNSNSNDNDNGNANDDNGNGNVNSNDDHGHGDNGNVNANDTNGNDDHGGNSNVNSNDNSGHDDQGGNGNVNANDNNGHDDHGGNGNANTNDSHGNDDHGGGRHGG